MVEVLALSLVLLLLSVEDVLSNEVNMSVATGALDGHLWLASDFIEIGRQQCRQLPLLI